MRSVDVIAAISSPPGYAVRAIVRLSGPGTYAVLATAGLRPALDDRPGGSIANCELNLGGVRVRAVAWCFRAPRSYTGEDLVELHLPGHPSLCAAALEALYRSGARAARPGEFTQRAFLTGKLDLAQCEAVLRLVGARDETSRRAAAGLLRGGRGADVEVLRGRIENALSLLEAHLDFEEVEIEGAERELLESLAGARAELDAALERWEALPPLRPRAVVALVGEPSVGKSSLFNRLVGAERALVDEAPGTTRDILREHIALGALELDLLDQPGLPREQLGAREEAVLLGADLLLCCVDGLERELPARLPEHPRRLLVRTRVDRLGGASGLPDLAGTGAFNAVVAVSAHSGEGLAALRSAIAAGLAGAGAWGSAASGELELGQRRALQVARAALEQAARLLEGGVALEIVAEELRAALEALDGVCGHSSAEDLLDRIFSRFCLGK